MKKALAFPAPDRRGFIKASALLAASSLYPCSSTPADDVVSRSAPYYSARSDLYGGLACARMALGYFEPNEHFPVEDVSDMIFHRPGYWVFEAQLIPILAQKGYQVELRSETDYKGLVEGKTPAGYGTDAGRRIDRKALGWAVPYLTETNFISHGADIFEELKWYLHGSFLMLSVSRAVLRDDSSLPYCRYNVVVTGVTRDKVRYHDPSLGPDRWTSLEKMNRAFTATGTDRAALRVSPPPPEEEKKNKE